MVAAAGRFRIYLGAAAGVGKTYAMLNEGQRRRARGADLVVGFVECHGREQTERLLDGLEFVPRKLVEYRGSELAEMDLDAVLARHPKIALVDELAHTNVPGSGRNSKRWQDVVEILDAGISVITTVNIQHLESIADETDDQLLEHLQQQGSPAVWGTAERILAAVTGAPGTDGLLRRAARIASRVKADLDVVHVVADDATRPGSRRSVERLAELTADLGAQWHVISGDDPVRSIIDFARQHQVTQIVIGSSERSRWRQLTGGGSNVARIIREAGTSGIDVHVIALRKGPAAAAAAAGR